METFNVYLKLEDGTSLVWRGDAEDNRHAEGLAIAWATSKTGQQIYDLDSENA